MENENEHLKVVLDFWQVFDLDSRRIQFDQQGLEIYTARENSRLSRTKLNAMTKDFRRMKDMEKLATMKDVLKKYQEEIDSLSKRARTSDNYFISLYKSLHEAPDPAKALAGIMDSRPRAAQSELEVQKLRQEISAYEKEFKELKNQDITIRKLEEQIDEYEEQLEVKVAEQVEENKSELEAEAQKRLEEVSEREAALERKLRAANEATREAKAATDRLHNQLFEMTRMREERSAGVQAEKQILLETMERHQASNAALTRENDMLRTRLEGFSGSALADGTHAQSSGRGGVDTHTPRGGGGGRDGLEHQVEELRATATRLTKDLLSKERALEAATVGHKKESAQQALDLKQERERCAALRYDLQKRPSLDEAETMKRQLRALQQLEFNVLDDDDKDDISSPIDKIADLDSQTRTNPEDTTWSSGHKEMEKLLMARLRRIQNSELSTKRVLGEKERELEKLTEEHVLCKRALEHKTELVVRLEDDLLQHSQSTTPRGHHHSSSAAVHFPHPSSSVASAELGHPSSLSALLDPENAPPTRGDDGAGGDAEVSMLGIVQAQRDRFAGRIQDLEKEKGSMIRKQDTQAQAYNQLQRDNLKLYEKVRYLQSYQSRAAGNQPQSNQQSVSSSSALSRMEGGSAGARRGDDDALERRYKRVYETSTNPFTQFAKMERQRKYAELSVAEKITLSTTRMFLSSKFARNFIFFYMIALHGLVMATTFHWAHTHSELLTNCEK